MKYFIDETARKASHSSCYIEFQKGRYQGRNWLRDSISIHDDLWNEMRLSELFGKALPAFQYYGVTVVERREWERIVRLAGAPACRWGEIVQELAPWVQACFADNDAFSILGI